MYATLSSKGQITIPAALRTLFGWRTGDALDFVVCEESSRVELVAKRNSVTALKGMIDRPSKSVSLEEMDAAIGRSLLSA